MYLLKLFFIPFCFFVSGSSPIVTKDTSEVGEQTTSEINSMDAAIVVWIDKSGSIAQGYVPKVTVADLTPLLDIVEQMNASLCVGVIGSNTREQMAFIFNSDETIKVPEKKDNMDAQEYLRELMKYKKKKARRANTKASFSDKKHKFIAQITEMLDYSVMHNQSKICEAINVSNRIFSQPNHMQSEKMLLMVTDYYHNGSENCPLTLSDTEVISVNRLSNSNAPKLYNDSHFVDMTSAVDYLTSKI